jgi:serine/threonine protein kinase
MTSNLIGKTLGDYRLEKVIGEGGMSTVYQANQLSLGRTVAVKVLAYQEDTALERFRREAKAIAALRHRNILIIYEYGELEKLPFIAMEYVSGGTLEDRLTGQPMAWQQAVELIIPIADALHYAHTQGIIHRDIKPSNVLMPQSDWPVLADFGLVKRSDGEKGLTLAGTFMGTPSYIAPEQARDLPIDPRVDMYALAVVLFEMVSGKLPFDHENPNKILLSHVMDPPPNPTDINPDCPPELAEVILKALEKEAKDRYADMQAFISALKGVTKDNTVLPESAVEAASKSVATPPEKVPSPSSGGIIGFFKRLLGFGSATQSESVREQGSKTVPQERLEIPDEDFDDEDSTIQLNLKDMSSSARIVIVDKNVTIALPQKLEVIIGRTFGNSEADVDLEPYEASGAGVSRRHARILRQGERWMIEDLNSLNGTFVNDTQIKPGRPVKLKNGDYIRLSHMKLMVLLA